MSKYLVTKLVCGRFTYYFQGLDAVGKPKWNGLCTNGIQYSKITAMEIQEKLSKQFNGEYDVMSTNKSKTKSI